MAGQEVGVAYYSLLPSARGFGKAVEKELDGAADGHERKQQSLWSKVTKYGAIAAAAIGTLFTAKILTGGLSRALNIEDAQAKLKGLGHDTETVTGIMQNALAAVKGTAFGLDQAATIAASAVAAGIKPGKQLERYLRLTADAAAIAGGSLDDLGRIFNNVTTVGAAYNDTLLNLAEKGLPIYQWLADELGVSTAAVKKLASEGKISSETFLNAVEKNIAGAALASGDTTRGAFANMQAAMSRWGANLLSGVLPFAKRFFDEMIVIFDGLNERSDGFVNRFNDWLKGINLEGFGDRFLNWFDSLDLSGLKDTYEALKPLIDLARDLGPLLLGILGPALGELRDAIAPVLPDLAEALTDAVVKLSPSLVDLLDAVIPLIPKLVNLAVRLIPVITEILKAALPLVEWVADKLTTVFEAFDALTDLWSGKTDNAGFLDTVRELAGLDDDLARGVDVAETIAGFFDTISTGAATAVNWLQNTAAAVVQFFKDTFANLGATVGEYGRLVVGLFTGDMDLIDQAMGNLQTRFAEIWGGIAVTVAGALTGLQSSVQNTFNGLLSFVGAIPGRIIGFFASVPARFEALGRQIVQGLINGITRMIGAAVWSVTSLSDSMLAGMKNWLGIKSPSRVFRDEVGAQIAAGVIAGVDGMQVQTDAAIRSLVTVPDASVPESAGSTTLNFTGVDPFLVWQVAKRELGDRLAVTAG